MVAYLQIKDINDKDLLYIYTCVGYIQFRKQFGMIYKDISPYKVCLFRIRINRGVELAMSVCSSVAKQTTHLVLQLSLYILAHMSINASRYIKVGKSRIRPIYPIADVQPFGRYLLFFKLLQSNLLPSTVSI